MVSDPIRVVAGVRQGYILSPLLFLIVIDEILVGAIDREPNRGLLWQPITMEHQNDFELSDDVALLAQRRSDMPSMQSKLDDLADRSSAAGLQINVNKTKSLDINTVNPSSFTVAGQAVENVESYQFLGSQMACDGGTKIDIGARIKKARAAFANLRNIWKNNQISRRTKTRIFNSNVKSVLLYAGETWCVSVENSRCLRYIIRAWWPHNWISNAELHRRCHQKPIATEIRERKGTWVGHALHGSGDEICKQALERWNPGHRSRGRPRGS
ncbi:uncharacterized protein LOC131687920 [Topomyia yanbarensis]|uniref:uncharacterized protein LOC131687920 n=1 Tax=Topomyia yanbarensis TaxID=2498891 RepID=UPI00273AC519|nr:uncharacterized protein LOC131687920 [Topomyia yanbarensis]